jgi:predicted O-methyltransferase YrrM
MKEHDIADLTVDQIFSIVVSKENIDFTKYIISSMATDPIYGPMVIDLLNNNQPETRAFMSYLSKTIGPQTYLEVGVRRGWSAGTVISRSIECEIWAFDEWHANYAGVPNPGPAFVESEMKKLGYSKPIHFMSGDSHKTLQEFFFKNPHQTFDLILIDGDHSPDGARQDLMDTMGSINLGGAMVFDDTVDCAGLQDVWDSLIDSYPNFKYFSFRHNKPGVSFAIRIS